MARRPQNWLNTGSGGPSKTVPPANANGDSRANNRTNIAGFRDLAPAGGMNPEGFGLLLVSYDITDKECSVTNDADSCDERR